MLNRYIAKDKYGGYTWQIKLDSLFHIYINGTNKESFVVEFKEFKWISYKTHFSFVSNENLELTIIESFERVFAFFQKHKNCLWTLQQKEDELNTVLELLRKGERQST